MDDDNSLLFFNLFKDKYPTYSHSELVELWNSYLGRNKLIIENFEALVEYYLELNDNWRYQTFNKVLKILKNYTLPILSGEQLSDIDGIGKSTINKINEIIKYGYILIIKDNIINILEKKEILQKFKNIWGVGHKKALSFYNDGYRSINDIPESKLNRMGKIGLRYYDDLNQRIPRQDIKNKSKFLKNTLKSIDKKSVFQICGSFRRELPTSGDIDILISTKSNKKEKILELYVNKLFDKNFLIESLVFGKKKFMGLCVLDNTIMRRIDILFIPYHNWGSALLYFTGPQSFNIYMRKRANSYGYKLSEHGLKDIKSGKYIQTYSEKNIFNKLDMKYVEPKNRI